MNLLIAILNVINILFFLLALAGVILGVVVFFKPSLLKQKQPPILEKIAIHFLGIAIVAICVDFIIHSQYISFLSNTTQHWITATVFLLFCTVCGIMTILGKPFLAVNLIPKLLTKRLLLGGILIAWGILAFFNFTEDYWLFPETIQDIVFIAFLILPFVLSHQISRIRSQAI